MEFNDVKVGDIVKVQGGTKKPKIVETKVINVKKDKFQVEYWRLWFEEKHWNDIVSDDEKKIRL